MEELTVSQAKLVHGPVPRLISRLQWGLNPPTADQPPPKFLFQFRNSSSIRLAARKLFRNCTFQFGGERPVGEELSCRLPGATKVLWSTTKMRAKPEYGAIFWFHIVVHQQGIKWCHQPRALHLQNLLRTSPAPNMAE